MPLAPIQGTLGQPNRFTIQGGAKGPWPIQGDPSGATFLSLFPTSGSTPLITEFGGKTNVGFERTRCWTDAAADLEATSSQYFSHAGNALLRGGATWYRCGWFKPESTGVVHTLFSTLSANTGHEIRVTAADVLEVEAGNGTATVSATHGTVLSAATWYFWEARYNGTSVGIALNAGAWVEQAVVYSAGTNAVRIGSTLAGGSYADGLVQMFGGGDGVPSDANFTSLYNAGSGVTRAVFLSTLGASLAGFLFPLHTSTGARLDTIGGLSLAANGGPVVAAGLITDLVVLNAPVKQVDAVAGVEVAKPLLQATLANQPLWIDGTTPYLDGDGSNDSMATAAFASAVTAPRTTYVLGKFDLQTSDAMCDGVTVNTNRLTSSATVWGIRGATSLTGGTTTTTLNKFTMKIKAAASLLRVNGVEEIAPGDAGSASMDGLTVLSAGGGTLSCDGRMYHIGVVKGDTTLAQNVAAEAVT